MDICVVTLDRILDTLHYVPVVSEWLLYPIWFIAPILTFNCALLSPECGAEFKIDPQLSYTTFIAETRGNTRANMIIPIKESLNI